MSCQIFRLSSHKLFNIKFIVLVTSFTVELISSRFVWAGCNIVGSPPGYYYYVCAETGAEFHGPEPLTDCQAVCIPSYTLTLKTNGTGSGKVSGEGTYQEGSAITLKAEPNADSQFVGWQPQDQCFDGMTLKATLTCTATFDLKSTTQEGPPSSPATTPQNMSLWLQVAGSGSGKVSGGGAICRKDDCSTDAKGELVCNTNCTRLVPTGSAVTLIHEADSDSVFSSWGGNADCAKGQFTLDQSKKCIAYFHRLYKLTVTLQGPGQVTSSDSEINCGTQCQVSYESKVKTSLQATPAAGQNFLGWSGDCQGTQNPLTVEATQDLTCTAQFGLPTPATPPGTVTKQNQKITQFSPPTTAVRTEVLSLTAIGGGSGNPVTFASTSPTVCTVSGSTVTLMATGTCTLTADQAGNDQYDAAPQVTATIVVNPPVPIVTDKQPQTITILSFTAEVGKTTALKVTGGGSQNPVNLMSRTTHICTIVDHSVTFVQAGECQIEATQSGNNQYDDAQPVTVIITVAPATTKPMDITKQNQTITAVSLTRVIGSGVLTAKGGGSNNPIVFASQSEDVCTVSTDTATFLKTGTCTLTLNQAGNDQYHPAPQVILTVEVQAASSAPTSTCAVLADAPVVDDVCDGKGKVASKTNEFGPHAEISNIVIDHPVINQGLLRNISITKKGKIERGSSKKGMLRGEIQNEGTLCNFELTGSFLEGGTLCGQIQVGSSLVKNVTLAANTTLSGGLVGGKIICQSAETSVLEYLLMEAGTELIGCKLGEGISELASEDQYAVFTQTKGKGSGVIRSNPVGKNNNGINIVELTAVADDNSGFTRWENDKAPECTGRKETVQVLVNDIKTCIAHFYVKSRTSADWANSPLAGENGTLKIHMEGSGGGFVKSISLEENSNGVNKVKLTAIADDNSVFGEWEGDDAPECVGTQTDVDVVVEGEKTCTAYFDAVSPEDKQQQKISIDITPSRAVVGGTLRVKTSGGASGNPVTLKTNSPEVCSLEDNTITVLKEGTCSITADQTGSGQYLDADPQTVTITVLNNKASILGRVSSDKDNSGQVQTATTLDTLNVSLDLKAAPSDVGQEADILLVAEVSGQWFKATSENGWLPWDKNMSNLGALVRIQLSEGLINLPIYQGTLPQVGTVNLFATYRLKKKVIRLDDLQKILSLSITAPPTLEQAKASCDQQGGIYFLQQCITQVPLLAEAGHFTGGIYRFDQPQAGLQTVVDLPCRLGKRIAILGSFQNEYAPGIAVEIVMAFVHGLSSRVYQYNGQGLSELPYIGANDVADLNQLSGKAMASLPSTFSGVFFEGELPSKGQLYAYFGYRLKNPDGSTQMVHYSQTPLIFNVEADSCINSDLELEMLPLGTGMGNVFSSELGNNKVALSALPAHDSILTGWQGDAEGCIPHPNPVITIQLSADKHTCHPVFERKVPINCDETNPTCPVIPEPCSPLPRTSKWILSIGQESVVRFTNRSSEARNIVVNLFDPAGIKVGSGNNVLDKIKPLATMSFDATALKDMVGAWTGFASMEVLDAKNLTVVNYVHEQSVESIATSQHRLYQLTPTSEIRISNTSDQETQLSARLFDRSGQLIFAGKDAVAMLPNNGMLSPHASLIFSMAKVPSITDGSWIEIYPQAVEKRCTGDIQLQHIHSDGRNITSSDN